MKREKIEALMKEDFEKLPPIPDELYKAIELEAQKHRKIFYKRASSTAAYHCTYCGSDYIRVTRGSGYPDISHFVPREGEKDRCKVCGNEAILKPKRRFVNERIWRSFYLWQELPDGMVCRYFETMQENSINGKEEISMREWARGFYYLGQQRNYRVYHDLYSARTRECSFRWDISPNFGGLGFYQGIAIGDPLEIYRYTPLKYCPIDDLLELYRRSYFETEINRTYMKLFETYSKWPGIEMECKSGMKKIVSYHIFRKGTDGKLNKKAKKPCDVYKVYPYRMKDLKESDVSMWEIYQFERKNSLRLNAEEVDYLKKHNNDCSFYYIKDICRFMSLDKAINHIKKYASDDYRDSTVIRDYHDYLNMREELGYDMTNTVYLFPRDLNEAHDRMAVEINERKNSRRIDEVLTLYPEIRKKYSSLKKRYSFSMYGYNIRPAKDAAEIVREGWYLHHCVGGNNYLDKHNTGKSAILFLRKVGKPDEPYVTIEVKGDRIIQWYGAHDRKEVTEEAKLCISEFEKYITDRKSYKQIAPNTDIYLLPAAF